MTAVGSTPLNVAHELQHRVGKLEPVVASYMTYEARSNRLSIMTLLDDFDEAAEEQLASIKLHLMDVFPDFSFDFATIHLQGREPHEFRIAGDMVLFERSAR